MYVPAGVPGATLTAPVAGFSVTFGFVVESWVRVTVASVAGAPLSVSFTRTFGTATPPEAPSATVPVSLTALIAAGDSVIVTLSTAGGSTSVTFEVSLSPGVGDDAPGLASYSSLGIVDIVGLGFNFQVGADGLLRLEFYEGFDDLTNGIDAQWVSGNLAIQISGVNDTTTADWDGLMLNAGSDGSTISGEAVPGKVIGPSFAADEVPDVIEAVVATYRSQRAAGELFIDTVRRIGIEPFKAPANAVRHATAQHAA